MNLQNPRENVSKNSLLEHIIKQGSNLLKYIYFAPTMLRKNFEGDFLGPLDYYGRNPVVQTDRYIMTAAVFGTSLAAHALSGVIGSCFSPNYMSEIVFGAISVPTVTNTTSAVYEYLRTKYLRAKYDKTIGNPMERETLPLIAALQKRLDERDKAE